jgi:hypothetical protein
MSLIIRLFGNVSSVRGQHTLGGPPYKFFPRPYIYVLLLTAAEQMKPKMPLPETHTNNSRAAQYSKCKTRLGSHYFTTKTYEVKISLLKYMNLTHI